VYALLLPGERVYIGRATDFVRRFAQHRQNHEAIEGFAYVPAPTSRIAAIEREAIAYAERLGLQLANVALVKDVRGDTDLDTLITREAQDRWVRDPFGVNLEEGRREGRVRLPEAQVARYRVRYEQLLEEPYGQDAVRLLSLYLAGAVPFPRTTEYSFWAVSCLPTTRVTQGRRVVVVNAGVIELFTLIHPFRPVDFELEGFVNVDSAVWSDEFGRFRSFELRHPGAYAQEGPLYRYASDVVQLHAFTTGDLHDLLSDVRVQRAAGAFALRIMRQRATIFTKFHAKLLADDALKLMVELQEKHASPDTRDPESILRSLVPSRYWSSAIEALASSIEVAHAAHPDRWGVRLSDAGVMLEVGPHEVFHIGTWAQPVQLVFDRESAPPEVRTLRDVYFTEERDWAGNPGASGFHRSTPGSEACRVPFARLRRTYKLLRPAHETIAMRAGKKRCNLVTQKTHSAALVEYVSRQVGRRLPQPDYMNH